MKKLISCLLASAMAVSLTACGGSKTNMDAKTNTGTNTNTNEAKQENNGKAEAFAPSKRFTLGTKSITVQLDPMYVADQEGFTYCYMIYDCLVESDHKGNYEPALAESWEVADDGVTWTFHLRKGVKFQNGQDFTSADVACSYQRVLDEPTCNMYIDHWNMLESVNAVDDYTVEIKTKEPFAMFLASVGWTWIIPHEAYEQYGPELFSEHQEIQAGTGPWMLTEYNEGQNWVAVKNENCWKPNDSYFDEVEVRGLNETATAISAHLAGDLMMNINLTDEMLGMYKGSENKIEVRAEQDSQIFYYCQYNCSEGEPFADPNLRLAFEYAVNRQAIADGLFAGRNGGVQNGVWCPSTYGFDASYPAYEYNLDKAKEYVAKSSYDGREIVLNVKTTESYAQEVGLAIAEDLNAAGIKTKVEPVEAATMNTIRADGTYDIFMVTQIHADGDAYSHLNKRILLDAHHSHYVNEELNTWIEESNKELDGEKRIEILHKINKIMREDPASQSNIVQYSDNVALNKGIINVPVYPDNVHYYRYVTFDPSQS